jgi:hypothetical protein
MVTPFVPLPVHAPGDAYPARSSERSNSGTRTDAVSHTSSSMIPWYVEVHSVQEACDALARLAHVLQALRLATRHTASPP